MKKRTRITLSILSLAIGLTALGVSITYAWTKTASTNNINYIYIQTSKEKNLLISEDKTNFVSKIDYEDETKDLYKPVSSYSFKWFDTNTINTVVKDGYSLPEPYFYNSFTGLNNGAVPHEPEVINDESGYFTKHLYLSCDDNVYVTIDPDSLKLISDESKNKSRAEALANEQTFSSEKERENYISDTTEKLNQVIDSMRISILYKDESGQYKYAIIDPYKDQETYFLGILNSTTSSYYDSYYDSNSKEWYETVYGYINDSGTIIQASKASDFNEYYLAKVTEDTIQNMDSKHPITDASQATSFNAVTKKDTHHYDVDGFISNHDVIKEESYSLEDIRPKEVTRISPIMIPVYKNTNSSDYNPTEIIVSVYMEGWDRDCINSTMGASFNFTLPFMIARETGK